MEMFFDESRNTGEIGCSNNRLNYYEQRYFVLVGFLSNTQITQKYNEFLLKYSCEVNGELKGSDLLTKDNNKALEYFINNIIDSDSFLVTVYDKKFFLTTQLLTWLLGIPFREEYFVEFHTFAEFIYKASDLLFCKYLYITKNSSKENVVNFLNWIKSYTFTECITSKFEENIASKFKNIIKYYFEQEEYVDLLLSENVENILIKKKYRNNIVNLTALGETILLYKLNNKSVSNNQISLFHDKIDVVEDYIKKYWNLTNLQFIDSKASREIQIADTLSSIVGKMVNTLLPVNNDKDLMIKNSDDFKWYKSNLTSILSRINSRNVKIVISMREHAVLKTFVNGKQYADIFEMKKDILLNLDNRMTNEIANNKKQDTVLSIFNR